MIKEEAENLRGRVAALEKERADLKYYADRMETKVKKRIWLLSVPFFSLFLFPPFSTESLRNSLQISIRYKLRLGKRERKRVTCDP